MKTWKIMALAITFSTLTISASTGSAFGYMWGTDNENPWMQRDNDLSKAFSEEDRIMDERWESRSKHWDREIDDTREACKKAGDSECLQAKHKEEEKEKDEKNERDYQKMTQEQRREQLMDEAREKCKNGDKDACGYLDYAGITYGTGKENDKDDDDDDGSYRDPDSGSRNRRREMVDIVKALTPSICDKTHCTPIDQDGYGPSGETGGAPGSNPFHNPVFDPRQDQLEPDTKALTVTRVAEGFCSKARTLEGEGCTKSSSSVHAVTQILENEPEADPFKGSDLVKR